MARHPAPEHQREQPLTERERQVLALMADGRTNGEIAQALGITYYTARNHVSHILAKLGVETRAEAIVHWHSQPSPPPPSAAESHARRWSRLLAPLAIARLGITAAAVGLLAITIAVIALVATTLDRHADAHPAASAAPTSALTYVYPAATTAAPVFAMHWLNDDEAAFVSAASAGALTFNILTPETGDLRQWPLPLAAPSTRNTYLLPHPGSGSFWIAAGYAVMLFAPETGEVTWSTTLEPPDPRMTPGAPDGTHVNGLVQGSDGAIILTRQNIAATFALTPEGIALRATLDAPPHGMFRVGRGEPLPYRQEGAGIRLLTNAQPYLTPRWLAPGTSVATNGQCEVAASQVDSGILLSLEGHSREAFGSFVLPQSPVVASGANLAAVVTRDTILRLDCATGTADAVQRPGSPAIPDGGNWLEADGTVQHDARPVIERHSILAIAINNRGDILFSDSAMQLGYIPGTR